LPVGSAVLGLIWPEQTPSSTAELVDRLDRATRLPGWTSAWTAPARARMDMMATGIRTPVGIRVVAATPERLDVLGNAVRALALRLPGTRSALFESLGGETRLQLVADPAALARHQVDPALVQETAEPLLAGGQVGDIQDGGRRLRLRVLPNVSDSVRPLADQLRGVTVRSSGAASEPVPLAVLAR